MYLDARCALLFAVMPIRSTGGAASPQEGYPPSCASPDALYLLMPMPRNIPIPQADQAMGSSGPSKVDPLIVSLAATLLHEIFDATASLTLKRSA